MRIDPFKMFDTGPLNCVSTINICVHGIISVLCCVFEGITRLIMGLHNYKRPASGGGPFLSLTWWQETPGRLRPAIPVFYPWRREKKKNADTVKRFTREREICQERHQLIFLRLMEQGELQWSWNVHCLHVKYDLTGVCVHWLLHKSQFLFTNFSDFGSTFVENMYHCFLWGPLAQSLSANCRLLDGATINQCRWQNWVANKFNGCWSCHCACYSRCETELNIISPELTINVAKGWAVCLPSCLWQSSRHSWSKHSVTTTDAATLRTRMSKVWEHFTLNTTTKTVFPWYLWGGPCLAWRHVHYIWAFDSKVVSLLTSKLCIDLLAYISSC